MSAPGDDSRQSWHPKAARIAGGRVLPLGSRTLLLGVVNVTPDSFHPASRTPTHEAAIKRALELAENGADIIDVGGESTRPGAPAVSQADEMERVLPVIEGIRKVSPVAISVDTRKSEVARHAIAAGADIVNDTSGLIADPLMAATVANSGAIVILMHMRGTPATMQTEARYEDVVLEVKAELGARIAVATRGGIKAEQMWIDPGLGFAKSANQNLQLLNRLEEFQIFEKALVIGASRKSFLGRVLGGGDTEQRLEASLAVAAVAVLKGAHILRVHDVLETRRVAAVVDAIIDPGRVE